jgi:antitoxin CptB
MTTDNAKLNYLKWRSRRGMLELDELLIPFADKQLATLNKQQQELYETLLTLEDPILYSHLINRTVNNNVELQQLINDIRNFHC